MIVVGVTRRWNKRLETRSSAVEHPFPDASMPLDVSERLVPLAGSGECAGAVGEQDGPQEPAEFTAFFWLVDEVAEVNGRSVDRYGFLVSHCVVGVLEDSVRAGIVAGAGE